MSKIVKANPKLSSVTAQDVGRDLYHGRQETVRIVGDRHALENIAWIFKRVPDLFTIQVRSNSLIVRRTPEAKIGNSKQTNETAVPATAEAMPISH